MKKFLFGKAHGIKTVKHESDETRRDHLEDLQAGQKRSTAKRAQNQFKKGGKIIKKGPKSRKSARQRKIDQALALAGA